MLLRKIPGPWETESNFLNKTSPADQTSTVEWLSPNIWNKKFFNLHFILEHKNSVLSCFNSKVILSQLDFQIINGWDYFNFLQREWTTKPSCSSHHLERGQRSRADSKWFSLYRKKNSRYDWMGIVLPNKHNLSLTLGCFFFRQVPHLAPCSLQPWKLTIFFI